jgi:hypothetical protein
MPERSTRSILPAQSKPRNRRIRPTGSVSRFAWRNATTLGARHRHSHFGDLAGYINV